MNRTFSQEVGIPDVRADHLGASSCMPITSRSSIQMPRRSWRSSWRSCGRIRTTLRRHPCTSPSRTSSPRPASSSALWCLSIIGYKWWLVAQERRLLDQQLLPIPEGVRILPEDTREYARQIQDMPEAQRRIAAAARAAARAAAIRRDPQSAGCRVLAPTSCVDIGGRAARLRARHDPVHRLGDPGHRFRRHGARHRHRAAHGPSRGGGRRHRRHAVSRLRVQFDAGRPD